MKIAAVFGSPRNRGNSESLTEILLNELGESDVEIERYHLRSMNYSGCVACDACKTKQESCILSDDLTPLLTSLESVDILVLASPVYFMGLTSQMKAFIDRLYSVMKPRYYARTDAGRLSRGKRLVFVLTQRANSGYFMDILQRYNALFRILGFKAAHIVRGTGLDESRDAASQRKEIIENCRETAQRLLSGDLPLTKIPPYSPGGYTHP